MTPNSAGRIDGIDFWRGFALLTIFINHLPTNVFQYVTHKNFGLSDAAELFVFLSGVSIAVAYGAKFFAGDRGKAVKAVLRRAFTLYWVQALIALLSIAMFAAAAQWWDNDDLVDDEARDLVVSEPGKGILAILMLGHQFENINILPMYIVLLLFTPVLLVLARRDDRLMLLASATIYAVARVFDLNVPNWPLDGGWYFNPLAWQLLFAIGLFVGRRIRGNGIGYDRRVFVACCGLLAASAFVVTDGFGFVPALWQDARGFIDHDTMEFASVLRFIETIFDLPPLTSRDANANDILNAFDFTGPPRPPLIMNTRTCPAR